MSRKIFEIEEVRKHLKFVSFCDRVTSIKEDENEPGKFTGSCSKLKSVMRSWGWEREGWVSKGQFWVKFKVTPSGRLGEFVEGGKVE